MVLEALFFGSRIIGCFDIKIVSRRTPAIRSMIGSRRLRHGDGNKKPL
jgi:hypothetical protein